MEYREPAMFSLSRPDERKREAARLARVSQTKPLGEPEPFQVVQGDSTFSMVTIPNSQLDDISKSVMTILGPYHEVLGGPPTNGFRPSRISAVSKLGGRPESDVTSVVAVDKCDAVGGTRPRAATLGQQQMVSQIKRSSSPPVTSRHLTSSLSTNLTSSLPSLPVSSNHVALSSQSSSDTEKLPLSSASNTTSSSALLHVAVPSSSPVAPRLNPKDTSPVQQNSNENKPLKNELKEQTTPSPLLPPKLETSTSSILPKKIIHSEKQQTFSNLQSSSKSLQPIMSSGTSHEHPQGFSPTTASSKSASSIGTSSREHHSSSNGPAVIATNTFSSVSSRPVQASTACRPSTSHSTVSSSSSSPSRDTKGDSWSSSRPHSTTPSKTNVNQVIGANLQHSTLAAKPASDSGCDTSAEKSKLKWTMSNNIKIPTSKSELNDIIKEMADLHAPLTGLETPHKLENGFHFSSYGDTSTLDGLSESFKKDLKKTLKEKLESSKEVTQKKGKTQPKEDRSTSHSLFSSQICSLENTKNMMIEQQPVEAAVIEQQPVEAAEEMEYVDVVAVEDDSLPTAVAVHTRCNSSSIDGSVGSKDSGHRSIGNSICDVNSILRGDLDLSEESDVEPTVENKADKSIASVADKTGTSVVDKTGTSVADKTGTSVADKTGTSVADKTGTSVADKTGTSVADKTGTSVADKTGTSVADKTGTSVADKTGTSVADKTGTSVADKTGTSVADKTGTSVADKTSSSQSKRGKVIQPSTGAPVKKAVSPMSSSSSSSGSSSESSSESSEDEEEQENGVKVQRKLSGKELAMKKLLLRRMSISSTSSSSSSSSGNSSDEDEDNNNDGDKKLEVKRTADGTAMKAVSERADVPSAAGFFTFGNQNARAQDNTSETGMIWCLENFIHPSKKNSPASISPLTAGSPPTSHSAPPSVQQKDDSAVKTPDQCRSLADKSSCGTGRPASEKNGNKSRQGDKNHTKTVSDVCKKEDKIDPALKNESKASEPVIVSASKSSKETSHRKTTSSKSNSKKVDSKDVQIKANVASSTEKPSDSSVKEPPRSLSVPSSSSKPDAKKTSSSATNSSTGKTNKTSSHKKDKTVRSDSSSSPGNDSGISIKSDEKSLDRLKPVPDKSVSAKDKQEVGKRLSNGIVAEKCYEGSKSTTSHSKNAPVRDIKHHKRKHESSEHPSSDTSSTSPITSSTPSATSPKVSSSAAAIRVSKRPHIDTQILNEIEAIAKCPKLLSPLPAGKSGASSKPLPKSSPHSSCPIVPYSADVTHVSDGSSQNKIVVKIKRSFLNSKILTSLEEKKKSKRKGINFNGDVKLSESSLHSKAQSDIPKDASSALTSSSKSSSHNSSSSKETHDVSSKSLTTEKSPSAQASSPSAQSKHSQSSEHSKRKRKSDDNSLSLGSKKDAKSNPEHKSSKSSSKDSTTLAASSSPANSSTMPLNHKSSVDRTSLLAESAQSAAGKSAASSPTLPSKSCASNASKSQDLTKNKASDSASSSDKTKARKRKSDVLEEVPSKKARSDITIEKNSSPASVTTSKDSESSTTTSKASHKSPTSTGTNSKGSESTTTTSKASHKSPTSTGTNSKGSESTTTTSKASHKSPTSTGTNSKGSESTTTTSKASHISPTSTGTTSKGSESTTTTSKASHKSPTSTGTTSKGSESTTTTSKASHKSPTSKGSHSNTTSIKDTSISNKDISKETNVSKKDTTVSKKDTNDSKKDTSVSKKDTKVGRKETNVSSKDTISTKDTISSKDLSSKNTKVIDKTTNGTAESSLPFNHYVSGGNINISNSTIPPSSTSLFAKLPAPSPVETQLHTTKHYLARAREHKHHADYLKDRLAKYEPYLRSGLSFFLGGYSMEITKREMSCSMYNDTYNLIQYVIRMRASGSSNPEYGDRERKIILLLIRLQAYINHRLYRLRRTEVSKLKRIIDSEQAKLQSTPVTGTSSSSANPAATSKPQAPSPHQNSWNKNSTGTPSPMSPTPSPAGSISSQGSCDQGKIPNGNTSSSSTPMTSPSPGMVSVHQQLHSYTHRYFTLTCPMVKAVELWEQADEESKSFEDFFTLVDNACGPLTFHSEPLVIVRYMKHALRVLNVLE